MFLARFVVISFIGSYLVSSVAVTAQQTVAAANAFHASRAQAGLRTPGPSNIDSLLPKFRQAKKVTSDAVPESLVLISIAGDSREADIPATLRIEAANVPLLPGRSPPTSV